MPADPEALNRERRLLALMAERISQFRIGAIGLGPLISDLAGLLAARALASDCWIDDFREAWGDLEIPYAVALDRLDPIPDANDWIVAGGLHDLDALVARALADLG